MAEVVPPDPVCANGYCTATAVTAVHRWGTTALVRPDHLTPTFALDWRCLECALDEVQQAIQGKERRRMAPQVSLIGFEPISTTDPAEPVPPDVVRALRDRRQQITRLEPRKGEKKP